MWELQRREDEIEAQRQEALQRKDAETQRDAKEDDVELGQRTGDTQPQPSEYLCASSRLSAFALDIPVPPKYQSADFASTSYWRLRGKLDVPKERFILYPDCEREGEPTLVLTWAGWNHLQQARALAAWYTQLQDAGASEDRLLLALAGIADLLPWLKLWHNDIDPTYQMRMGAFYREFVDGEAKRHGTTAPGLEALRTRD